MLLLLLDFEWIENNSCENVLSQKFFDANQNKKCKKKWNNNNNNHNNITSHSNQSVEYGKSMNKEDVREIVKNVQDAVNVSRI